MDKSEWKIYLLGVLHFTIQLLLPRTGRQTFILFCLVLYILITSLKIKLIWRGEGSWQDLSPILLNAKCYKRKSLPSNPLSRNTSSPKFTHDLPCSTNIWVNIEKKVQYYNFSLKEVSNCIGLKCHLFSCLCMHQVTGHVSLGRATKYVVYMVLDLQQFI